MLADNNQFERPGGDPYPLATLQEQAGYDKTLLGTVPDVSGVTLNSAASIVTPPSSQFVNGRLPVGSVVMAANDKSLINEAEIAGADSSMMNVEVPGSADADGTGINLQPDSSIHGLFGVVTAKDGLLTGETGRVCSGFKTVLCRIKLPAATTQLAVNTGLMYDFTGNNGALTVHTVGTKCIGLLAHEVTGGTAEQEVYAYVRFNGTYGFGG